jgi:hypothetical protein
MKIWIAPIDADSLWRKSEERKEKETEKLREQLNEIKVKMEKVNSNV